MSQAVKQTQQKTYSKNDNNIEFVELFLKKKTGIFCTLLPRLEIDNIICIL